MSADVTASDFSGGYNSFTEAWQLQPNELQEATNAVIENGSATPLKTLGAAIATGLVGAQVALYKLLNYWLGSTTNKRYHAEINGKVAFVNVGLAPPQWWNGTVAYQLGMTPPASAPTLTLNGAGNVTQNGLVAYVTFVNVFGEESGPSPASNAVTAAANRVDISAIPTSTDPQVSKRRVYVANQSALQELIELADNTTTTATYNVASTALSQNTLQTVGWGKAPSLERIWYHNGRLWGSIGDTVYWSEVGQYHAWKATSNLIIGAPIVNGCSAGSAVMLLTAARVFFVDGDGLGVSRRKGPLYGCEAPQSLCDTEFGQAFWSTQGLVLFSGGAFQLLTDKRLSKAEVAALDGASLMAAFHRGTYHLFHAAGGYLFNLRAGGTITKTDQAVSAVFASQADDALYVQDATETKSWAAGAAVRTMALTTKEFNPGGLDGVWHCKRVSLEHAGDFTVSLFADGAQHGLDFDVSRVSMGRSIVPSAPGNWAPRKAVRIEGTGTLRQIRFNPPEKVI